MGSLLHPLSLQTSFLNLPPSHFLAFSALKFSLVPPTGYKLSFLGIFRYILSLFVGYVSLNYTLQSTCLSPLSLSTCPVLKEEVGGFHVLLISRH